MALNRVDGPDELYVGGIFALRRPAAMEEKRITHILSMIQYSFVQWADFRDRYVHLSVDIDDVEDADLLVHLPKAVRFIETALHPESEIPYSEDTAVPERMRRLGPRQVSGGKDEGKDGDGISPATGRLEGLHITTEEGTTRPAVFVHCAMGKSRSVSAVVAYLLWKHPHRYGLNPKSPKRPDKERAWTAVRQALDWVRKTRPIAEPNPGFMEQLRMWVEMGMPADSDDAVERNGTYQRWIWEREVEESARIGKAPDWIRFEDETEDGKTEEEEEAAKEDGGVELRCKKCRRVLATKPFIIPHQEDPAKQRCPHYFVEALSWMKPALETGELDGRLVCPNAKCGASVGRYAWQGFKCSCGEWVCPAISLQSSKVDEVAIRKPAAGRTGPGQDPRSALGIRLPPGMNGQKQNL
ncbi:putative tyrosine-protein phosphatase yvh1 protein [Phaeoacremonium minimum UCRPA7]|uniref:protein-tyrosine-phosphatase n=1 Tax=Phaeoacremonium minimum (strain UCR-PA7) TaxID=1286976 RepID=R8B8P1_PHAM7|nr:putative tyrosine-protein phosphatase yvh1 protein [Phaeoacremonium minimum UCRPA7]EON95675.1 putative tyrosine-protein phosphatase yvh1 protein [Phaeoacremonium minimum UCRPA7]